MKNKLRIRKEPVRISERLGDPGFRDTFLTVRGSSFAVVENYRRILRYTDNEIVLATFRGFVTIKGAHLKIPGYTSLEMQIRGEISEILLHER